MSAITSHPRFDLSKLLFSGKTMCRSIPLPRATTSWLIILIALVAFEVFNFSTTEFALTDVLGDLSFAGWHWATILAVAFCAMDFAGIARLFGSPQGKDQPAELWYLLGAWLLAATMNAILTWWAVSLALLEHGQLGNEILARETLIRTVPIFVAILVWLLRVLLIGTFSLSMHTKRNVPVEPIKGQPGQASSRGELAGESGHPSRQLQIMSAARLNASDRSPGRPISRPSQSPVRPRCTGLLGRPARWLPVVLSFCLSSLALGWVFLGDRSPAQASSLLPPRPLQEGSASRSAPHSSLRDRLPAQLFSPVFSPTVMYWASDIERWSLIHHLNPNLVATVMQIESCGHPAIRSPSGAIGLFQVMPYHFSDSERPEDPDTNAARGLEYLAASEALARGRLALTLAGYNGGHAVIPLRRDQWTQETRRYVRWGMGILKEIAAGENSSATLRLWLEQGGDRLCQRAQAALALSP